MPFAPCEPRYGGFWFVGGRSLAQLRAFGRRWHGRIVLIPLGEPAGRTAWNVSAEDGREFAVFVVDSTYHVADARCPHNKGPLAEGTIRDGTTLVCPWHRFRFDLATGACANHRMYDLRVYPVVERDGAWYADVGEPPRPQSLAERLRSFARGES